MARSASAICRFGFESKRIRGVRRLESDLQGVLDEVAREEFGREMHTFPYRRLGAS